MDKERMIVPVCGVLLTMFAFALAGSAPIPLSGEVFSYEKTRQLFSKTLWLTLDDGTQEIFLSSDETAFIVANRFAADRRVVLSAVSFYTGGAAAGSRAEIIVYDDPSGASFVPDAAMEVFREEVTIGPGGFQDIPLDELVLNGQGEIDAAFYVGISASPGETLCLGIDKSGSKRGASSLFEDGSCGFVPLAAYPILDGNAMIRAREASPPRARSPYAASGARRSPIPHGSGPGEPRSLLTELDIFRTTGGRDENLNSRIREHGGSDGCPACSPALDPGYPRFTLGAPDRYEDFITVENVSASAIEMPFRASLLSMSPESVFGFNTDDGGGAPPSATWAYSLANNDGIDSADDLLGPGERVSRLWRIADEGGLTFTFWADLYAGWGNDDHTELLLHGDMDIAGGHAYVTHGTPQLTSVTKKLGTGAMYFNGAGDYLEIPDSADWAFGSDDFTIDAWVNLPSVTGIQPLVHVADGSNYIGLYANYGSGVMFAYDAVGAYLWGPPLTAGTWHHLAVVRTSGTALLFVDGALEASAPFGVSDFDSSGYRIGAEMWGNFLNGHIDELRISKGVARWTSPFTPPSAPYSADGPSKLLMHMDCEVDASDSAHELVVNGILAGGGLWDSGLYFDGNGHYVTVADSADWAFGSDDFTIDAWVNLPSVTGVQPLIHVNNASNYIGFYAHYGSGVMFAYDTVGAYIYGPSITPNTWHHLALVRSDGVILLFVDGVMEASAPFTVNDFDTSGYRIGAEMWGNFYTGYVDELRVSRGIARWTDDFTPPVEPYR